MRIFYELIFTEKFLVVRIIFKVIFVFFLTHDRPNISVISLFCFVLYMYVCCCSCCLFVCLVFGGRGGDEEGGVRNGGGGREESKNESK